MGPKLRHPAVHKPVRVAVCRFRNLMDSLHSLAKDTDMPVDLLHSVRTYVTHCRYNIVGSDWLISYLVCTYVHVVVSRRWPCFDVCVTS